MAQYFEVLSQSDGNLEQTSQFFNGNQDNERTQVQYILTEDSAQLQTQQLILSADQVMVLDNSQQQIQGVVIDQGHTFRTTTEQFSNLVQNTTMANQSTQQIFYMETHSNPTRENLPVPTVIEQAGVQSSQGPQGPIVLNHQLTASSNNIANRQILQGTTTQRPVLQIRTPLRQGHTQVNQQTRPLSNPMRSGLPQQVRTPQSAAVQMRNIPGQPIQMRLRGTTPQIRQPVTQQSHRLTSMVQTSLQAKAQLINRQMLAMQQKQLQQQQQQVSQQQVSQQQVSQQQVPQQQGQHQQQQPMQQQSTGSHIPGSQAPKSLNEFQQRQQQLKASQEQEEYYSSEPSRISIGKQIIKPISAFRTFIEHDDVEELDDHDPTMNSSPGQLVNYKKLLEQKQIGKNPILARLPSNIKVTTTPTNHQPSPPPPPPPPQPPSSIAQTIDQVVSQVAQQHIQNQQQQQTHLPTVSSSPKKPRAPPRPRNANSKQPPSRQKNQRVPTPPQQQFNTPRVSSPQPPPPPRFTLSQQQQQARFVNQQPLMQPQQSQPCPPLHHPPQQQQPPPIAQSQQHIQQNGIPNNNPNQPRQLQMAPVSQQSQMNYLITPPTPNRPRQQHPLPAYIPSSQIQQIIESTPIADEFSDSIRMLVLLENGEQRLITFTLPKEACTIQEILEQVNVPFTPETNIQVTEANTNGINYIVTVGNISNFGYAVNEEEQQPHNHNEAETQQQMAVMQANQQSNSNGPVNLTKAPFHLNQTVSTSQSEPPKPSSPPPKLVSGKLAVCSYCGYTGEDFNKCRRCNRRLPENVKSIEAPIKTDVFKSSSEAMKQLSTCDNSLLNSTEAKLSTMTSAINNPHQAVKSEPAVKSSSPVKKKFVKPKPVEHESVIISSDEEEDEKKPVKSVSEQLLNKLGASISICPVTKEPSLNEIKKHVRKISAEPIKNIKIPLKCRTVRIGSYRFVPTDDVILDSKCVIIKAPVVDNKPEVKTLRIDRGDIVKVLVCVNKALPVIFYYLNVGAAPIIRDMLNLTKESGFYFDPIDDKEDSYRKITLLPDDNLEEIQNCFEQLYGLAPFNILEEITAKEANDILIKSCPKDSNVASAVGSFSEIKQILMYPKEGQGRLSINTEDYVCLAVDMFLNDKIIDFYLKYLWENLPPEKQEKVHIFSTFFYKRLTTKIPKNNKKAHPLETDPSLTAAEQRHWRVKNWTKKINLFEKDFIIVPINENAHWFLAIICFPWMRGCQTFDGKPYSVERKSAKAKNPQIDDMKKEKPISFDDTLLSDKDEADSEDSDMESDESEETAASVAAAAIASPVAAPLPIPRPKIRNIRPPIKQPCILIFDSLAGPSRSRVVATLRNYLTVEFKMKMESERIFNKDVIRGSSCKVPQQNNFTDCGLYLLQYVEHFFKEPIMDYHIPIKGIENWFEEITVTKKREDICNLIKELMIESGGDIKVLPDIALPTLNGKLLEKHDMDRDHETGEEEQEDMFTDIEDSEMTDASSLNTTHQSEENCSQKDEDGLDNSSEYENSPIKPSENSQDLSSEIVTAVMKPAALKPTLSEFPRQTTNKDTLNYLKSKRINRHKSLPEGPEFKRTKMDD